jgi:phthiocerol/phenolphthiocerol synthesis type-I polyketide synthase E
VSLVAARGLLMEGLPAGAMLAVHLPEERLSGYLDGSLALAAVNGPSQCVVAGEPGAVDELALRLGERGVPTDALRVSRAFHSAMMDPIIQPFLKRVRRMGLKFPAVPFISSVTGTWIRPEEAVEPEYWARQLRHTVRLGAGFRTLAEQAERILLEVGPGRTLCGIAKQQPGAATVLPSLPQLGNGQSELEGVLSTMGRLWLGGADVDWAGFTAGERRRRIPLPTYHFERRRFWVEPNEVMKHNGGRSTPGLPVAAAPEPTPAEPDRPMVAAETGRTAGSTLAPELPRTPTEAAVIVAWRAVLGDVRIGVWDNFYDLGGHSVMIPSVVRRLSATFQIDLPVLSLMEAPTVEELAQRIEAIFRIRNEAAACAPSER